MPPSELAHTDLPRAAPQRDDLLYDPPQPTGPLFPWANGEPISPSSRVVQGPPAHLRLKVLEVIEEDWRKREEAQRRAASKAQQEQQQPGNTARRSGPAALFNAFKSFNNQVGALDWAGVRTSNVQAAITHPGSLACSASVRPPCI